MEPFSDARIVDAWLKNAEPWCDAVRGRQIPSRELVTNQAIISAVLQQSPTSALDLGCGEGWLCRALAAYGVQALGVDVVPALIDRAREMGGAQYETLSYESVAAGALKARADTVICNFSLLGDASVERLIAAVPALLNVGGALVIQTLHPLIACGKGVYEEGWRAGSWAGFSGAFSDPAPWFFRTLSGWVDLLNRCGLALAALYEPLHPHTARPASVIFVAKPFAAVTIE